MNCPTARISKICSIFGIFLLLMPVGIQWFWGNLSIYILSYYHHRDPDVVSNSSWIITLVIFFRGILLILCGYSKWVLERRATLFVGASLFNLGIILSYFALQQSMIILNLTLGVVSGIGTGLLYGATLDRAMQWCSTSDLGLITSIVQSAYPLGAVVINQFLTMYLNPSNSKPDCMNHGYNLFSQESIINRVPKIFLIFGLFFSAIQFTGLLLIREGPEKPKDDSEKRKIYSDKSREDNNSHSTSTFNSGTDVSTDLSEDTTSEALHVVEDKPPKQMFLSPMFYILAATYILSDYVYLIVTNYYKIFGQLSIRDDYFLTLLGLIMVICNVPSRLMCGVLTDRVGVKNTFIVGFSTMTISCAFSFVMPNIQKWLYVITTTLLASLTGAVVTLYTLAIVRIFGRKYSIVNVGWLSFVVLIISLIAPPIMEYMLSKGEWAFLFFSGSAVALSSLILIIIFLPAV